MTAARDDTNTEQGSGSSDDLAHVDADLATRDYSRRGVATSDGTIRVVLIDDHTIVRAGLKALLRSAPSPCAMSRSMTTTSAPVRATSATASSPDLASPTTATSGALARDAPSVRVLILTMHAEQERLLGLLKDGARGYLSKDAAQRELLDAIRVVASGDIYVRPSVARMLAAAIASPPKAAGQAASRYESLSDRERAVLRLVAEGFNGPEIGLRLAITAKTVDTYKQRIENKIGLAHRSDYVRFAVDAGLLGRSADS
jgi:DNA-binding NarL/FixJ family response regulator